MNYRSEIDGLRAIAVVPVVLFHAGFTLFSGGFVGVDMFFVISGYLITTIIAKEVSAGTFSIVNFYARRARRILPALFFVVLVSLPFAWMWMLPLEFKDYAQSITAVSIFSSNFLFWIESGYFAPVAELKPLLHTWSLAVEEQYYIIFPLLMMVFWSRSAKLTVGILCLIFVASLVAAEWGWRNAPEANFYLLIFRAWELMVGSLCAIWMVKRDAAQCRNEIGGAAGLTLIVISIFLYTSQTPFPSLYALVPVLGTAMVIVFAQSGTVTARLLSLPVFVGIGLISYSAYLWHQPLFAFARLARDVEPPHWVMLVLAVLSFALAVVSWRFVERPFRRSRLSAGRTVFVAGVVSVVIAALGAVLSVTDWQRASFIRNVPDENVPLLGMIEVAQNEHNNTVDIRGECVFWLPELTPETIERFTTCADRFGPAVTIFGDSHSRDVFNGVGTQLDRDFVVGIPQMDCRPHIVGTDCTSGHLLDVITMFQDNIEHLFYVQAGFWLLLNEDGDSLDRNLFQPGKQLIAPQVYTEAVDRALPILQSLNEIVPLTWIGPRLAPYVRFDAMLSLSCNRVAQELELRPNHVATAEMLDIGLADMSAAAGIDYVSEIEAVNFDIKTDVYNCDDLFWSDTDHWSTQGEARFGPRLARAMDEVLGTD